MREQSDLIKKSDVSADAGAPLDRPIPFYPSSRYDAYPGEVTSGYNRLHEYWRSIRKHIWLILGIVVLVTTLTAVYMARQPESMNHFRECRSIWRLRTIRRSAH